MALTETLETLRELRKMGASLVELDEAGAPIKVEFFDEHEPLPTEPAPAETVEVPGDAGSEIPAPYAGAFDTLMRKPNGKPKAEP